MGSSIKRNSSVELLKVIAICLIVISHTTQSVGATSNSLLGNLVNAVNYKTASKDVDAVILMVFRHFGAIGNVIFMVCSSWFLVDEKNTDYKKVFRMIFEVWMISVLILLFSYLGGVHINQSIIIKSLLPTFENNNWYITCYMLIYSAHGLFNVLIEAMNKKMHCTLCLVMSVLFLLLSTVKNDAFFNTNLMVFSTIYFVVAFIKRYRTDFVYNRGMNRAVLLACSVLLVGSIVVINYAGLKTRVLSSKVLALAKTCNPLIVGIAISGFHLSIGRNFYSKEINYVSSLSLLIYLIHENIILRMLRPAAWELFTVNFNGVNVVVRTLALAAFVWLFAFAMASIYKIFVEKQINRVADRMYSFVDVHACKLLKRLCRIDKGIKDCTKMSFQQEKKDIVLISSGEKKSGVYRVESELIDEWVKQGHKVSIVLVNGRITHDSFGIMAIVEEKDEPHFKPFALIHRFFRLQKFFRIHKDATILALSISADCFAALFGRTVRNKVVISERNDPNQYPDSVIYKKFRDFCFRLVDACVFQTQEACNYFPESVRKKGVIIPNPINNKIPEFERTEINKTVMSTGRLKPQKNFPLLIKAFAGFSKSFPDYTLEIYGDGYLHQELEDLASEFGVHSKVRFMPFTTDIFPVMAKASMFVMSSNYEGISNSMLEAMAIGVPTICTDCPVGGARQMIEDGVNGLLVPVGDVEALANAMCKVAADKDYADMLGRNGHEIRKKYPIEVIARKWIDVL